MKEISEWIGAIIMVLSAGIGVIYLLAFLVELLVNGLGRLFSNIWIVIEYCYYRTEFKEWVKDKERIKKPKKVKSEINSYK